MSQETHGHHDEDIDEPELKTGPMVPPETKVDNNTQQNQAAAAAQKNEKQPAQPAPKKWEVRPEVQNILELIVNQKNNSAFKPNEIADIINKLQEEFARLKEVISEVALDGDDKNDAIALKSLRTVTLGLQTAKTIETQLPSKEKLELYKNIKKAIVDNLTEREKFSGLKPGELTGSDKLVGQMLEDSSELFFTLKNTKAGSDLFGLVANIAFLRAKDKGLVTGKPVSQESKPTTENSKTPKIPTSPDSNPSSGSPKEVRFKWLRGMMDYFNGIDEKSSRPKDVQAYYKDLNVKPESLLETNDGRNTLALLSRWLNANMASPESAQDPEMRLDYAEQRAVLRKFKVVDVANGNPVTLLQSLAKRRGVEAETLRKQVMDDIKKTLESKPLQA